MTLPIIKAYKVLNQSLNLKTIMDDSHGSEREMSMIFTGRIPKKYQLETEAPFLCLSNCIITPDFRSDNQTEIEKLEFVLELWTQKIEDLEPILEEVDRLLETIGIEPIQYGMDGENELDLRIGWKKYVGIFPKNGEEK